MARNGKAEGRLLLEELLSRVPGGRIDVGVAAAARRLAFAEQARLRCGALLLLGGLERAADRSEQARAQWFQRIEGTGTHQGLYHTAVHHPLVDAAAKIEEIGEERLAPSLHDRLDGACSRAAHGAKAVADALVIDRREAIVGSIDIGRQDLDPVRSRVLVELAH